MGKPIKTGKEKPRPGPAKKLVAIAAAFAALLLLAFVPLPGSITQLPLAQLTAEGQATMAILVFCLIMWITQAVPFHITGLLSLVLFAVLKVAPFNTVVKEGFGSNTVIFFLCVLIVSAFISASGLGRRVLTLILSVTGNATHFIVLGFLVVGMLVTMWVTALAVTAMLVPIALEILERENIRPMKSNFGRALMISCAFGPVIGGIASPAGAGCNPLAIEFLRDMAGVDISFAGWMKYGVPCALLLILPAWGLLMLLFPPEMKHLSTDRETLRRQMKELPPMSRDEKVTAVVFLLTVALWLATPLFSRWLGIAIPVAMPVCLTSCLFFFPGMSSIKWNVIEQQISWSSIILILSGISLGSMLYGTGAAKWMAAALLGGIGGMGPWLQMFVVVLITCIMKTMFSSNTVTATILIPILIALAQQLGVSPMLIAFPAALASPLSLILVTSSPNNVIPYSTGYFSVGDMAKAGLALIPVAAAAIASVVYAVGGLSGVL